MTSGIVCAIQKTGSAIAALRRVKEIFDSKAHVAAGFLGNEDGGPGQLTTTQLALIHEFGAPAAGIPARPFILPSHDKHRPEYQALLERTARACIETALKGGDAAGKYRKFLALIGTRMKTDIQNFVTQGEQVPPPNAPATLARKLAKSKKGATKAPRTLVDTGRMIGAVGWEVREE